MVNIRQTWLTMVNYFQSWLTMVSNVPPSHCDKYFLTMKIKHGPMLHSHKDCLNMRINHGQTCSNVAFWQGLSQYEDQPWLTMANHAYFRVLNIYLMVYIPWFYNINPLGLILFPCVHNPLGFSINPLGLLFH